jgi:hypothetical protein
MLAQLALKGGFHLNFILLVTKLAVFDVERSYKVTCLLHHGVLLVKRKILDVIKLTFQ